MFRQWKPPPEGHQWMTHEIADLLRVITGRHAGKKRTTVIKLAFALANGTPFKQVFKQPDVCAENIWYMKWKHRPEVKAAYDACYERALEWRDQETARAQEYYRGERLRKIAEYAANAPDALAAVMADSKQRGADRISAANALITWADPEEAQQAQPHAPAAGGPEQTVNLLTGLTDDELDDILANLEAATGGDIAGEAAASVGVGGREIGPADVDDNPTAEVGA